MPLRPLIHLDQPIENLSSLPDYERIIRGGPIYDLQEVKKFVQQMNPSSFRFTPNATTHMQHELRWRLPDLCGFINCLQRHHYKGSQWCYASQKARIAFPADVYIMGYSHATQEERPLIRPKTYYKFSFSLADNTIEVFSVHLEK